MVEDHAFERSGLYATDEVLTCRWWGGRTQLSKRRVVAALARNDVLIRVEPTGIMVVSPSRVGHLCEVFQLRLGLSSDAPPLL